MSESLGSRLRRQREERQIDLVLVAAQSKIKLSLLEGLERDDLSQWPAGIFRRAYIRTYARLIGLDPEAILREFLELYPDPADATEEATAALAAAHNARSAPPTRLRTMVDSALGSLARLRRPSVADEARSERAAASVGPAESASLRDPAEPAGADALNASPETAAVIIDPTITSLPQPASAERMPEQPGEPVSEESRAVPQQPPMAADDRAIADPGEAERPIAPGLDAALIERDAALDRLDVVADLCTAFGRAVDGSGTQRLLEDCARLLDAAGLIVWVWDEFVEELRPALVHGYPDKIIKQLSVVKRDDDNATADAFRTAQSCEVAAAPNMTGALVLPLLAAHGCVGVLAIELQQGCEPARPDRAVAKLLAAALTQLLYRSQRPGKRTGGDRPPFAAGRHPPPVGR